MLTDEMKAAGWIEHDGPKPNVVARWGENAGTDLGNYERHVERCGENECWEWTGTKNEKGYGTFKLGRLKRFAHRVSYEIHIGPIPKGVHVLHHCDNPPCTNPAHLWLGTNKQNHADKVAKGRQAIGERHGRTELTKCVVKDIRALHAQGMSRAEIARTFGLSWNGVDGIIKKRTWRHVD